MHTVFEHHAAMTPVALEAFLYEYRITRPIGVDMYEGGDPVPITMRSYALNGTPSLMLIDRAGRLHLQHFGRLEDLVVGWAVMQLVAEPGAVDTGISAGDQSAPGTLDCTEDGCPV